MKSDLRGPKRKQRKNKYPYLGIFQGPDRMGLVVLFNSENTGTAVHDAEGSREMGYVSEKWTESRFERLQGEIVLRNT